MSVLAEELAQHIEQLQDLESQLLDLDKGRAQGLMDHSDELYILSQVQKHLRQTAQLQRRFAGQQASLIDALPAQVALLDSRGNLFEVNAAWQGFARLNVADDADAYLGKNYLEICDRAEGANSREAKAVAAGLRTILSGKQQNFSLEYPCHAPSQQRWFRLMAAPLRLDGHCGAVVMHIDITERKLAEMQSQRAARVFSASNDGIMITDATCVVLDVNPAFSKITGYSKEEVLGQQAMFLNADLQATDLESQMWQSLNNLGSWRGDIRNRRKNGDVYVESLSVSVITDEHGDRVNYIAVFSDVTQLKAHQAELNRVAHHDALTGLPNRRLLTDRLQQAMRQTKRTQQTLAVCYIDLDNFKPINDSLGHAAGDRVLIEVATRFLHTLRETDTVSRIGGDEFVLLLSGIQDVKELNALLKRLMNKICEPITLGEQVTEVFASMGVVLFPDDDADADTLLRHADQAMYTAKESGRNRYHIYDAQLARKAAKRISQIKSIQKGLRNHEFILYYQPKVNLRTGQVVGVEALVRWQHPKLGLLPPAAFLDDVIGSDIEISFGDYVLKRAVKQLADWHEQGVVTQVSINVSGHELRQLDLAQKIEREVKRYPSVCAKQLEIEVLETAAVEDIAQAMTNLNACRSVGLQISLDDFGTGYSSLTVFRKLPIDTLKIDKSFVLGMLEDADDHGIVESVIRMAQALNRNVIAEGVETPAHARALMALGCEQGQGFGIARPLPADEVGPWLAHWEEAKPWQSF